MRSARRGFTLVEMVVALAASSIVVLAGTTLVLLTLRVQSQAYADVSRQDTARVALTMVETLAEQGKLDVNAVDDNGIDGVLYTSGSNICIGGGTVLMTKAALSADTHGDRLLTLTLTDNESYETYSTTVFCRNWPRQPGPYLLNKTEIFADFTLPEEVISARYKLLKTAVGQFGSKGEIKGEAPETTFAEWYNTTWTPETNPAWCACFVSWCIEKNRESIHGYDPTTYRLGTVAAWTALIDPDASPTPGDVIIFNFNNDEDTQADHVGLVLRVDGDTLYTVEGNNNDEVVIAQYDKTADADIILGYVELPWDNSAGTVTGS